MATINNQLVTSNDSNTSTRTFKPISPFVSLLVINAVYLAYPKTTISAIVFVIEASSTTSSNSNGLYSILTFLLHQAITFFNKFWLEKVIILGVVLILNLINTGLKT